MKTKVFFELEISTQEEGDNCVSVLINRFRTLKDLLNFKEKAVAAHGDAVKKIIIKRINTELL